MLEFVKPWVSWPILDQNMRTSNAFEAIEDPNDPAWHGHAPETSGDDRWRGRGRLLAIAGTLVVVVLLFVGVVAFRGDGASAADSAPSTKRDRASDDPLVRPSAVIAAEAIPTTPADAAGGATTARPVAPVPTAPVASPAGSGWAPAAATVAPEDTGSGLLVGDLTGVHPELIRRLDALAVATGREIEVISGWRTRHEQEGLYQSFLSGAGNLAAVPGTSNHESGRAADVYIDGVALASVEGVSEQAAALGLHFPVSGEAWHVEMLGS